MIATIPGTAQQFRQAGLHAACLAVLAMLMLAPAGQASAQSTLCRMMQAELAALETGRSNTGSPRFQQYDQAVRQQQSQIQKTERAAARNGCTVRRSSICNRINSSLAAMYANLDSLRRERERLAPRAATSRERAQLIRTMRANGCFAEDSRQASVEPDRGRRRTLLEQIFGSKTYSDRDAWGEVDPDINQRFGTYRTLCVRACDGYYFPISFSTTSDRFEVDLGQCQSMCPGAETDLYIHPMPGGDAEQSMSYRTGAPYSELPNAFAYRQRIDQSCTCRATASGIETVAGEARIDQVEPGETAETRPLVPLPVFRINRDLDLDGLALAGAGLTARRLMELAAGSEGEAFARSGSTRIRIVGPEFFPVQ